jgi:Matrixin
VADICRKIPQDAIEIIRKKCRVVNICAFISPGVEITHEAICKQIKKANDIWCRCGIMFNLTKIKRLQEVVDNPNDFDFDLQEIDSADDFFAQMPNYPTAERLYNFKPCCTDGRHVTLHYVRGSEFQSGEHAAGKGDDTNNKYFIMMTANAPFDEILAHELGHCLGLGHVNDANNVMLAFPSRPGSEITSVQCSRVSESPLVQKEFCDTHFRTEFPKLFKIEILNIIVSEVDDGLDINDDLEVGLFFNIQVKTGGIGTVLSDTTLSYGNFGLNEGASIHLGLSTIAAITSPSDLLTISMSGIETDDYGDNDTLPNFSKTFNEQIKWGTNPPNPPGFHSSGRLENSEIECEIFFKITAVPPEEKPIPGFCANAII